MNKKLINYRLHVDFDHTKLFARSPKGLIDKSTIWSKLKEETKYNKNKKTILSRQITLIKKHKDLAYQSLFFALLSNWAYKPFTDEAAIKAELNSIGITEYKLLEKNDTQCFVINLKEHVVVVYRGTSSLKDAYTDIKFNKVQDKSQKVVAWNQFQNNFSDIKKNDKKHNGVPGEVHAGVSEALDETWSEVTEAINEYSNDKPVIFAGHSLGGGLALLASMRASSHNVHSLHTIGGMKTGNNKFVKGVNSKFRENYLRWVNANDIVPRLLFFTFAHGGKLFHIDNKGQVHHKVGVLFGLWDFTKGLFKGLANLKYSSVTDHDSKEYIKKIRDYLHRIIALQKSKEKELGLLELRDQEDSHTPTSPI
jgi:hypothetical protein